MKTLLKKKFNQLLNPVKSSGSQLLNLLGDGITGTPKRLIRIGKTLGKGAYNFLLDW